MKESGKCVRVIRWLVLLVCCAGLFHGRAVTAYAGTLTGVVNLHQTEAEDHYFTVEWDKDINADAYEFQYSTDSKNWSSSRYTSGLSILVSGLNSGRSYYVRMRSYSNNGYLYPREDAVFSAWSAPVEVITAPETVPYQDVKEIAASSSSITVSWAPAYGATYYEVMYEMGGSWFSAGTTTATSYTIRGLDRDTAYYVSVKAVRRSRTGYESGYYNTTGHRCYTTSAKVTGCALQSWDTAKNNITLKWNDVSGYGTGYQVYIYNFSGKKVKSFKTVYTSEEFKLSSVKNQGFTFQVRSYLDVDGKTIYGPWSSKKVVVSQPRVKLKKSGSGKIQVSWNKVKGASGYTIYRSTSPYTGFKKIKTVKTTKYVNKGLSSRKTYYYYVVANGVKVNGKKYQSTKAADREIAYISYTGKTVYIR